jgi:hypothetical protein
VSKDDDAGAGGDGAARVASGEVWRDLVDALGAAERLVDECVPATPAMRAEGYRYLTRYLSAGALLCVELADPDWPELQRMVDTTCSWGIDNPDCIYLYAAIRGDACYRLRGHAGSARHLDVQISRGHFADAPAFGVIASRARDDLPIGGDGALDLWIGPESPPDPERTGWLRSEPDAAWLLLRQYFADWERERPADLDLERVGAHYPPPPPSPAAVAERLDRLARWLDGGARYFEGLAKMSMDLPANTVRFIDPGDAGRGGLKDLAYGLGNFRCGPDEAVILELAPPHCAYWSFALGNGYWDSLDWSRRQSSLNDHQARLDADGVFRAVISARDPGVPNWLDPQGHGRGTLFGRYLRTRDVPQPAMRVVPFAELRRHLPADTPSVTQDARSVSLVRRHRAAVRRNRR